MEKLVNEKNMVILYPNLAVKIGLNEAIMLQHIHFWLQDSKHHRDGRVWVYNTYQSWQKQVPILVHGNDYTNHQKAGEGRILTLR